MWGTHADFEVFSVVSGFFLAPFGSSQHRIIRCAGHRTGSMRLVSFPFWFSNQSLHFLCCWQLGVLLCVFDHILYHFFLQSLAILSHHSISQITKMWHFFFLFVWFGVLLHAFVRSCTSWAILWHTFVWLSGLCQGYWGLMVGENVGYPCWFWSIFTIMAILRHNFVWLSGLCKGHWG